VTVFWVLLGIAVLGGVALVVAAGAATGLSRRAGPPRPRAASKDRPRRSGGRRPAALLGGLRGYRMDEVDDVLDRLAADIAIRDAHIDELERQHARGTSPRSRPVPVPATQPGAPDPGTETAGEAGAVEGAALRATGGPTPMPDEPRCPYPPRTARATRRATEPSG
jgi:hypothetical protein